MLSSTLARASRVALAQTQRRQAGGFPARMAVKKNKFIEEWNGQREITEKTFGISYEEVPGCLLLIVILPYGVYTWTRSELKNKGDRRYQNLV